MERNISARTRLIVITNLHNPSGVRSADAKLRIVGEIARSMGAHVLVDEVYLEACFDSPWQTAYLLGPNFVTTSSLTKAYGLTGLRCGWIFAAKPLAERMWRLNDLFGVMAPHPDRTAQRARVRASGGNCRARETAAHDEPRSAERISSRAAGICWRSGPKPGRSRSRNSPAATPTLFASCYATSTKPALCPAAFSKCRNIFASASAGRPRTCAKAWRASARRWMSWPRKVNVAAKRSSLSAALFFAEVLCPPARAPRRSAGDPACTLNRASAPAASA